MPLVVSRRKQSVSYIRSEEALAELLAEADFGGHSWAIGDRLIFEDGTESIIVLVHDGTLHVWGNPVKPADLEEVRQTVGRPAAESWEQLFASFKNGRSG